MIDWINSHDPVYINKILKTIFSGRKLEVILSWIAGDQSDRRSFYEFDIRRKMVKWGINDFSKKSFENLLKQNHDLMVYYYYYVASEFEKKIMVDKIFALIFSGKSPKINKDLFPFGVRSVYRFIAKYGH
jgi:hypothetical protein